MGPPGGPLPASQSQQNQLGAQPPTASVAACDARADNLAPSGQSLATEQTKLGAP